MTTSSVQDDSICARSMSAIDSMLASAVPVPRRGGFHLSALQEDPTFDLDIEQDVLSVHGYHPNPGPRTTSENGDPINEQLLRYDQLDIEAARSLGLPIPNNAITVKHYWLIVKTLRDKLLEGGLHSIQFKEEYARILLRLEERLVTYPSDGHSPTLECDFVPYSRRRDYVECLGMLLEDIAKTVVVMKLSGVEDDVYIIKNRELYADHLSSLASRLRAA